MTAFAEVFTGHDRLLAIDAGLTRVFFAAIAFADNAMSFQLVFATRFTPLSR
jgi:hypothetical protein